MSVENPSKPVAWRADSISAAHIALGLSVLASLAMAVVSLSL